MNQQTVAKESTSNYLVNKLFIKNLSNKNLPEEWESSLLSYFSYFGPVIDIKVIAKRLFKSLKSVVWIRHVQGRRNSPGSIVKATHFLGQVRLSSSGTQSGKGASQKRQGKPKSARR